MKFIGVDANLDDGTNGRDWYANLNISVDKSKEETLYAQMVLAMESEVMIVPKSYFNVMKQFNKEIFEMIGEKYPELAMKADYAEAVEFANKLQ